MIDPKTPFRVQLQKSNTGQPVVAGHAALALMPKEVYSDIEHYDHRNS